MSTTVATATGTRGHDGWYRAWPLRKPALLVLAKGAAAMLVVWSAFGLLFMQFLDEGPAGDADRDTARWLEDHRTTTLNTLTEYGSMLSDTLVKVILVAAVGARSWWSAGAAGTTVCSSPSSCCWRRVCSS